MIEISDIKDEDSLKTWLTEWPEQAGLGEEGAKALAVTIANRSAMRVLPVWWRWSRTDTATQVDLTALPVLRSGLFSGAAVKTPTPDVRKAANAAATAATAAGNAAIDAANAANAAANAAFAATFAAANATVIAATTATANAAFAADAEDFWDCVRKDCQIMAGRAEVLETSLWHSSKSPIEAIWTNVKNTAMEPEWSFWIKWYEDALAGRAPDWDLLEKIALIDSEIWDAGPVPVAEEIARLQTVNDSDGALVGNEMNPHAAEVHYPGQTDALSRNTHVVGLQIDTLRAFLTSEMETLRGCNDIDAADAERIQARVAILRSLVQKTEEMSEALLDQADPETALVLLEENLPMIVQGADQLSAGESEPVVSETIIAMAASIKHLTDNGTPGHLATGVAFFDLMSTQVRKWLLTNKKKPDR